jgi:hypothetical protein
MPSTQQRSGAALILAILLLVVLDCIIIGVLQIAAQQRRIAESRLHTVRGVRTAESALRIILADWPHDSAGPVNVTAQHEGLMVTTRIDPVGDGLVLLTGIAASADGRSGHHAASLLAHPPVVGRDTDLAAAALSADAVLVGAMGLVSAVPPLSCTATAAPAIRADGPITIHPGGTITGTVAAQDSLPLQLLDRIAARAAANSTALSVAAGDTLIEHRSTGVVVAGGSVIIASDAQFDGLVLAAGRIIVEAGAAVRGALHGGGEAVVLGHVHRDPCSVAAAVTAAGLTRARPLRGRSWIPAFPAS